MSEVCTCKDCVVDCNMRLSVMADALTSIRRMIDEDRADYAVAGKAMPDAMRFLCEDIMLAVERAGL